MIIGGGFTGFGAAIPLARAGLVLVLEAAQIGSGASTRNGGITSGNIRLSFDDLATVRPDCRRLLSWAAAARVDLYAFITNEGIEATAAVDGLLGPAA